MNLLISQNNKILSQLKETERLLEDKEIGQNVITKLKMVDDVLEDISSTLKKLNINLKRGNEIELTNEERDFLKCEKDSNKLLSQVMPALIILSINNLD